MTLFFKNETIFNKNETHTKKTVLIFLLIASNIIRFAFTGEIKFVKNMSFYFKVQILIINHSKIVL
jgi:hypothetical protein